MSVKRVLLFSSAALMLLACIIGAIAAVAYHDAKSAINTSSHSVRIVGVRLVGWHPAIEFTIHDRSTGRYIGAEHLYWFLVPFRHMAGAAATV